MKRYQTVKNEILLKSKLFQSKFVSEEEYEKIKEETPELITKRHAVEGTESKREVHIPEEVTDEQLRIIIESNIMKSLNFIKKILLLFVVLAILSRINQLFYQIFVWWLNS